CFDSRHAVEFLQTIAELIARDAEEFCRARLIAAALSNRLFDQRHLDIVEHKTFRRESERMLACHFCLRVAGNARCSPDDESRRKRPCSLSVLRSRFEAAITRTSSGMSLSPPTRRKTPSSKTRKSFACKLNSSSPISSRKSVPPSACSNKPSLRAFASVNAPF